MKKVIQAMVLLVFLIVSLVGTTFAADEMVLRIARHVEHEGYDPHITAGRVAREVFTLLYDRLVFVDIDGEVHPWLAKSWDISDDNKEITFYLQEGVTFHDGTPLNAEAVKFNFDRLTELDATAADQFPNMTTEVIDELTIKFYLENTYAPFFHSLASPFGGIVSPAGIEEFGDDFYWNPVGSGPFKFEYHDIGNEAVFSSFSDYKNFRPDIDNPGPPHVDKVIFYAIPEESTRGAALLTGEVDIIETGAVTARRLEGMPGVYQVDSRPVNVTRLGYNQRREPLNDLTVRKAVSYAIDIEEIGQLAFFDYHTPNYTFLPTGVMGYNPAIGFQYGYYYNPERAIELFEEAGYEYINGRMMKDGQQLELDLLTQYAHFTEQSAEGIQGQLADIGVKVNIILMDVGTFLDRGKDPDTHDLYVFRTTWAEPVILSRMFLGGGFFLSFNDPKLDEMLNEAASIMNFEKRQGLLDEINKYLLENAYTLPLYSNEVIFYARDVVEGYQVDPQNFMVLNDIIVSGR